MSERIPIGSPVRTEAIINRYLLQAKKNLGQNFLVDQAAIQGIITAAGIQAGDQVIEIGPGIGSLTEQLLLADARVASYELDSDMQEILQNELPAEKLDHFRLLIKDILKADFKQDLAGFFDLKKPVKVVANLPYYITTPIIFFLAASPLSFNSLTLMMQKEVAQRLAAPSGNKQYGPLSIAVQTQMQVKIAFDVKPTSFIPRPGVISSVVVLKPLVQKPDIADPEPFNRIVKMCFAQRRKTLANNLKALVPEKEKRTALISQLGLDPRIRPEKLTIAQFIQLAQRLDQFA